MPSFARLIFLAIGIIFNVASSHGLNNDDVQKLLTDINKTMDSIDKLSRDKKSPLATDNSVLNHSIVKNNNEVLSDKLANVVQMLKLEEQPQQSLSNNKILGGNLSELFDLIIEQEASAKRNASANHLISPDPSTNVSNPTGKSTPVNLNVVKPTRRLLKWFSKLLGKDSTPESDSKITISSEILRPLMRLVIQTSPTTKVELDKTAMDDVFIVKIPIKIEGFKAKPGDNIRRRRDLESHKTNITDTHNAIHASMNASNTSDMKLGKNKETATMDVEKMCRDMKTRGVNKTDNQRNAANNHSETENICNEINARRAVGDNVEVKETSDDVNLVKHKLRTYIKETMDEIGEKVNSVKAVKIAMARDVKYQIGYIVANIDVVGLKVKKVKEGIANEKGGWTDHNLFSLLDSLKQAKKFLNNLLNHLHAYIKGVHQ